MRRLILFTLMSLLCWARTPQERLDIARLEAVHAQRVEWMKKRVAVPLQGVYHDYRAILHIHAEDADHTKGTRAEVLKAAKDADVNVIMFTDHRGPKPETWRGMRDGVLFIAGAENDHELTYPVSPSSSLALRFLSHLEERPDMSSQGFQGQEIYNRHTDAVFHKEFHQWMNGAMKDQKEWNKLVAKQKQFPDEVYAAATDALPLFLARFDKEIAVRPFTGIAANDAHQNQIFNGTTFDPYAVAFRFVSTHILARDLTEPEIRSSLAAGHAYVSHDWLCDPAGFSFVAHNNLGVYDMGDQIPLMNNTRLEAHFPIEAKIKVIRGGQVMAEVTDSKLTYTIRDPGAYRLEAWLTVDGEDRPWIYSNPIYAGPPPDRNLPPAVASQKVEVRRDIAYIEDAADKHKLDLYLPKDKQNFPMFVFIHGGSWRSGDRNLYTILGNRFAESGIGVAVPSYRLMPKDPHPAQIEDTAAAVAWVFKHMAEFGGDPKRMYIGGHSAGGHLVALLALDDSYLKKYDVPISAIKGVAALSGVYDVSSLRQFQVAGARDASSMHYLTHGKAAKAPPFLITYCQWDYPSLPLQAREFEAALKKSFVNATLVYVPGENHISEMVNIGKDEDVTARAILELVK